MFFLIKRFPLLIEITLFYGFFFFINLLASHLVNLLASFWIYCYCHQITVHIEVTPHELMHVIHLPSEPFFDVTNFLGPLILSWKKIHFIYICFKRSNLTFFFNKYGITPYPFWGQGNEGNSKWKVWIKLVI